MVIVPNGVLANDIVTNITQPDRSRRVTVLFGVEYGTDPAYVKHIVMEEIHTIENVDLENSKPRVIFRAMGASSLDFEALYWVSDLSNFIAAREDGTTKIYERLNKEGIGIPFPQSTVWFNDRSKIKSKAYTKRKIPLAKKSAAKSVKKTIKKTPRKSNKKTIKKTNNSKK
jgi:small-conductance mechanosensitive channel